MADGKLKILFQLRSPTPKPGVHPVMTYSGARAPRTMPHFPLCTLVGFLRGPLLCIAVFCCEAARSTGAFDFVPAPGCAKSQMHTGLWRRPAACSFYKEDKGEPTSLESLGEGQRTYLKEAIIPPRPLFAKLTWQP